MRAHAFAKKQLRPAIAALPLIWTSWVGIKRQFISAHRPILGVVVSGVRKWSPGRASFALSSLSALGERGTGCKAVQGATSPGAQVGPTTNAEDQKEARKLRETAAGGSASTASASDLQQLPAVVIDEGTFKYVLMQVTSSCGEVRYLVRGTAGAPYHKDVAAPYVRHYMGQGFNVNVLGGGRIQHDPDTRKILIYGFSYGFPWADGAGHQISADVCRTAYPDYEVTWSNDGY